MEHIRFEHITKIFGSTVANNDVSFTIEKGEVLSILGENGSGKTTLLNVLAGIYQQDEGKIFIDGEEVIIKSPRDAFSHKIGMVHQHFKLVEVFTAVENIVLGLTKEDYLNFSQKLVDREDRILKEINEKGEEISEEEKAEMESHIKAARGFNLKSYGYV